MRPISLAAVAELAGHGQPFDYCLASFLDGFNAAPSAAALAESPGLLAPAFGQIGRVQDAYLAATAEELSQKHGLPIPRWIDAEERKLRRPWFASSMTALRAVLLLESPPGFRSRNLFVSENALARA
jgi:hypothetical protein